MRRRLPAAALGKRAIIHRKTLRIQSLIRAAPARPCARGAGNAARRRPLRSTPEIAPAGHSTGIVPDTPGGETPGRPATRACAVVASTSSRATPDSGASGGSSRESRAGSSIACNASSVTASASENGPETVRRNAREVGAGAKRAGDVLRQHPDVGALAAGHPQHRGGRRPIDELDGGDLDGAGNARHLDAGARVVVVGAAAELERGERRRCLDDRADEARQCRFEIGPRKRRVARAHDFALGVAGGRRRAELHRRDVLLRRVEQRLRELRGIAEAERQEAGRQGIERARCGPPSRPRRGASRAAAPRSTTAPRACPAAARRRPAGAGAGRARAASLHHESGLRSAATASSISCDRRMPDSIESS